MNGEIGKTEEFSEQMMKASSAPKAATRMPNGQWPPGTTGNAKGRPKKQERASSMRQLRKDALDEAHRLVPINVDGKIEQISVNALLVRQFLSKALKEGSKQIERALDWIARNQLDQEYKLSWFYQELEKVEEKVNLPPLDLLETKTPETIAEWRKWSRKL